MGEEQHMTECTGTVLIECDHLQTVRNKDCAQCQIQEKRRTSGSIESKSRHSIDSSYGSLYNISLKCEDSYNTPLVVQKNSQVNSSSEDSNKKENKTPQSKETIVIADGVPHPRKTYNNYTDNSYPLAYFLSLFGLHNALNSTQTNQAQQALCYPGSEPAQSEEIDHLLNRSVKTSADQADPHKVINKNVAPSISYGGSPISGGGLAGTNMGSELVMAMVYGSLEECSKKGCGMRLVPRSELRNWNRRSLMDKDGTLEISFDEWRDYLLFHPSANLQDIIQYWRHATNLDVGEDLSVPDDFSPEEWISGKWWRHLVSGGVAGMVSRTCTAPLDRLKVFLQVHGSQKFQSLSGCFSYMLKEGGVKSLWRGNGINVLKIAPESAIKFAAYEQAKSFILNNFGEPTRELSVGERFCAGSFAGAFSQTVIYPMEVLKTRLALRKSGQFNGIADATKKIYMQEGVRSFYRGYVPNLLGIIPYAGIDLAVYETLKKTFAKHRQGEKESSVFVIIGCGALSSSCGQVASYPLALIRTRLQAQVRTINNATADPITGTAMVHQQPTTTVGMFKQIVATEGIKGLYRGIAPNFLKVAPAVSISYVVYEKCREFLGVKMT